MDYRGKGARKGSKMPRSAKQHGGKGKSRAKGGRSHGRGGQRPREKAPNDPTKNIDGLAYTLEEREAQKRREERKSAYMMKRGPVCVRVCLHVCACE